MLKRHRHTYTGRHSNGAKNPTECCENMVFERLLKLSVVGKISVEKFRDVGVLFASRIIMTREPCTETFVHGTLLLKYFSVVQVY